MVPGRLLVAAKRRVIVALSVCDVSASKDDDLLIDAIVSVLILVAHFVKLKVLSAPWMPATVQL